MTKLIKIGGSYGIRIPKAYIDKTHLRDCLIDLKIQKNGLLLAPQTKPRKDWDTLALKKIAKVKNDYKETQEDIKLWEW